MLSNIVTAVIEADASFGLTRGTNLFAQQGSGDKYVLIRAESPIPWASELPDHKETGLQILVKGYGFTDGYALAEKINKLVLGLTGTLTYGSETYSFSDVILQNGPVDYKDKSSVLTFTSNFKVYYHLALA